MAKVTKLEIAYGEGKVDKIFIRRPRFSTIMRIAGILSNDAISLDGTKLSQQEKLGKFFPQLIAETVSDEKGKVVFTPDDVDSWTDEEDGMKKIMAYGSAINTALNPPEAQVAGN